MRHPVTDLLLSLLVLGCATAPGPAATAQEPTSVADESFEPIRFGDPAELDAAFELFPGTEYDPSVPLPAEVLGQPVGTRTAHPDEIVEVFRRWAELSPRVTVETYARSFENRELVRAVITSEANHERLDEILDALGKLADPRTTTEAEAARLADSTPACAWMGYSIHGDEISGADASMAVGYHLIAGTSDDVTALLDDLVIVIDPVMNPDGRERFVSQLEQARGYVPNMDYASMQRGRWPEGRGNHYLFDMNRDWIAGVAPETRGRWRQLRHFNPQLMVDAHEMGQLDTYLFYPQSPAHNPHLPATLGKWHQVFATDQGAAFDAEGWSFYTREWADAFAPFYSDAYGSLSGAIGMLYEMASTKGQPVMRASGEVVSYRRSVHKQATSSLANLNSLRANREAILVDFAASKRANLEVDDRWFVCVPGRNRAREVRLTGILLGHGIEVSRTTADVTATNATSALGEELDEVELPAGTLVVHARQPLSPLVMNYLGFDIRMSSEELLAERTDLETKGRGNIYDTTAWNLPHALGVDAWWCDLDGANLEPITEAPVRAGAITPTADGSPATGWAVDGSDDAAVAFAGHAMELGLLVHLSDKAFTTAGRTFPRGSLLVRRHENDADRLEDRIAEAARRTGVEVVATGVGRSPDDGPDLGGGHFELLARPRIAVLANSPVSRDTFGHLWYLLDYRLRVPYSLLDATSFGWYDLRRYNVIVLPPASGSLRSILQDNREALSSWVRGGGTLVACDRSAAMLANESLELSSVRLRRSVLDDLDEYAKVVERERAALDVAIDEADLWGDAPEEPEPAEEEADGAESGDDADEAPAADGGPGPTPEEDSWMRRFSPAGVFLRGEVSPHEWITSGVDEEDLPVFVRGSEVFLAKPPARTAVRLAAEDELRLSGLLWPEARTRLADSSWLTVERLGSGQVILFAAMPGFRGYQDATARLFANAVILGPGAGASQPIGW